MYSQNDRDLHYVRINNVPASATFSDILVFLVSQLPFAPEPDEVCIISKSIYNTVLAFTQEELAKSVVESCREKTFAGKKVSIALSTSAELKYIESQEPKVADSYDDLIEYLGENESDVKQTTNRKENDQIKADAFQAAGERTDGRAHNNYSPMSTPSLSTNDVNRQQSSIYEKRAKKRPYIGEPESPFNNFIKRQKEDEQEQEELVLKIKELSARFCVINWRIPRRLPKMYKQLEYKMLLFCSDPYYPSKPKIKHDECTHQPQRLENFYSADTENPLIPGKIYEMSVFLYGTPKDTTKKQTKSLITEASLNFRTTFNVSEMRQLYEKAKSYLGNLMHGVTYLFRCKPKNYFDKIYGDGSGPRIMEPYKKDENGQAANPINGCLDGFFFSAKTIGESLADSSPFGEVRMVVEADKLLKDANLYFCDFYCNAKDSQHYITVVSCKKGSKADRFCRERLILLSYYDNNILKAEEKVDERGNRCNQYYIGTRNGFLVEVFYTEQISLLEALTIDRVGILGKGHSYALGIPHYKQCTKCNLYPVTFPILNN